MRKFYSFIAFAVLSLVSLTASAWSYDLPEENAVLQSEEYGMRLYKSIDFFNGTVNGVTFGTGDGCLTVSETANTEISLNVYNPVQVLNEGLEFMYIQIFGAKGLNARSGVNKDGLHNYGSGARWFAFSGMKKGQIMVLQHSENTNDGKGNETTIKPNVLANNANTGWADTPTDPIQVEDITEAIHSIQDLADANGDGEPDGVHDGFHYWRVLEDGYVYVDMERNTSIQGIQIWIGAEAAEAVTAPSLKVVGVNGDSRNLEFKPGESTFGSQVYTYYSIDGSDPLYLKDSEEVAEWDIEYDEEGNEVSRTPLSYKKVLDTEAVEEYGAYGDNPYVSEDGYFTIQGSDDEDGDGIVVLKAASVSENGAISDIVSINVNVGEVTLNSPSLTLSGVNGLERTYTVGWTNNTLCKEDYSFVIEDDKGTYLELDPNVGIGYQFISEGNPKVTVKVNGYNDGVTEQEAFLGGVAISKKNEATEAKAHDWDFVNISENQYDLITQNSSNPNVVEKCYIETPATEEGAEATRTYYTAEEFSAGIAEDGTDLSEATPVCKPSGWWPEIASNRTTLNVVENGGNDQNENGYGYEKDELGLFDGLTLSCPPNTKNASCIFKYIGKSDWENGYNGDGITQLGVYFMARPTFTFPRESAAAGEIVAIYYGQGGSNYTSTRTLGVYEVPVGELLSVQLPNGGVHVFYIDVYTHDNLPADEYVAPEPEDPTAISSAKTSQRIVGYYSINGTRLSAPQKGINVVKYADGATMKVLVK